MTTQSNVTNTSTNDPAGERDLVLILGATGKTGRRIVSCLEKLGVPVRLGS